MNKSYHCGIDPNPICQLCFNVLIFQKVTLSNEASAIVPSEGGDSASQTLDLPDGIDDLESLKKVVTTESMEIAAAVVGGDYVDSVGDYVDFVGNDADFVGNRAHSKSVPVSENVKGGRFMDDVNNDGISEVIPEEQIDQLPSRTSETRDISEVILEGEIDQLPRRTSETRNERDVVGGRGKTAVSGSRKDAALGSRNNVASEDGRDSEDQDQDEMNHINEELADSQINTRVQSLPSARDWIAAASAISPGGGKVSSFIFFSHFSPGEGRVSA
jgi:hypothetical protein